MSKFWKISLKNLIIIILLLIIFIIISLLYAKKNIKKGSSEAPSSPICKVGGGSCNLVKRYIHKTGMYSPDINTRLPA